MDRIIPIEEQKKRRRRRLIKYVAAILVAIGGVVVLLASFRSGISASELEIVAADRGVVEVSVSATGKVIPLFEEVITSPVASKIVEVYKKPGELLKHGDAILRLDLDAATAEYGKLQDEVAMKRCRLDQQAVASQSKLSDLKMQVEVAEMKLRRMAVELKNEHYLDSIGASTSDKVRQAELNYKVESLMLEQLKQRYRNEQLTANADLQVTTLDFSISKKSASLMAKQMNEAQVRSPREAVLTWLNSQIGSVVNPGTQLAIVSDLKNFKVEAEISDAYAERISAGAKAIIRVGKDRLEGTVANVTPSVKNGIIAFTVILNEGNSAKLRAGLKVDVSVIESVTDSTVRLANGAYYIGKGEYELWIVNNGLATKRPVKLGNSSFDFVEVIQGINPGEKVIISSMVKYSNSTRVKIVD